MGIVPIINANDTVSIQELDFEENDTLSAIVAALCSADLLIILTDVDGLYDKNPKLPGAKLIPEVKQITSEMISVRVRRSTIAVAILFSCAAVISSSFAFFISSLPFSSIAAIVASISFLSDCDSIAEFLAADFAFFPSSSM